MGLFLKLPEKRSGAIIWIAVNAFPRVVGLWLGIFRSSATTVVAGRQETRLIGKRIRVRVPISSLYWPHYCQSHPLPGLH